MVYFPRGIAPELLLSQVKNTMPYLLNDEVGTSLNRFVPVKVVREYDQEIGKELTHFEYFRLCLCSHFLTCASPVPTDVDNQIRCKLWPKHLPLEVALQMAQLVLESQNWDFTLVSTRFTQGAAGSSWANETIGGHQGEWLAVSTAAYCALEQYQDKSALERRQQLLDHIAEDVRRHSEVFGSLWKSNDGLACLKSSANMAHNFGDFDRVMDMWNLDVGDPLRLQFYKLGATPFDPNGKLRYLGRLWVAGELYKSIIDGSSMAFENHRHYALRKPRTLRQSLKLLIPNGPFFDDWGRQVAFHLRGSERGPTEDRFEVIEALKYGWERLPRTIGYGRALKSLFEEYSELSISDLPKVYSSRTVLQTPQKQFEKKWNEEALKQMDDIPSRA